MATFQAQIEGMTQISIGASTSPSKVELDSIIKDAITCTVNKITNLRPDDAVKFTTTSLLQDGNGLSLNGKILGVLRNYRNYNRPATQIPAILRSELNNPESFNYRSAYNPAFYILDNKIYVSPIPSLAESAEITQLFYDSDVDSSSDSTFDNFPSEYTHLIMYYSAAMTCLAKASDIQKNMPEVPIAPIAPSFSKTDISLPDVPFYLPKEVNVSGEIANMKLAINKEDFDMAEKLENIVTKELEIQKDNNEQAEKQYERDSEIFKSALEVVSKNSDSKLQKEITEYRSHLYKYQYEISQYSQELQEKFTSYKWYIDNYSFFMKEYTDGITLMLGQPKKPGPGRPPKAMKPQEQERYEEEE